MTDTIHVNSPDGELRPPTTVELDTSFYRLITNNSRSSFRACSGGPKAFPKRCTARMQLNPRTFAVSMHSSRSACRSRMVAFSRSYGTCHLFGQLYCGNCVLYPNSSLTMKCGPYVPRASFEMGLPRALSRQARPGRSRAFKSRSLRRVMRVFRMTGRWFAIVGPSLFTEWTPRIHYFPNRAYSAQLGPDMEGLLSNYDTGVASIGRSSEEMDSPTQNPHCIDRGRGCLYGRDDWIVGYDKAIGGVARERDESYSLYHAGCVAAVRGQYSRARSLGAVLVQVRRIPASVGPSLPFGSVCGLKILPTHTSLVSCC